MCHSERKHEQITIWPITIKRFLRNSIHLAIKIVQMGSKPTFVDAEILDAKIRFFDDILISDVVGKK